MSTEAHDALRRAREASLSSYERGRRRVAVAQAVTVCLGCALLSLALVGGRGLLWLPVTFLSWAFVAQRGVGLLRGARLGAVAGLATLALPMSVLRQCCRPGALEAMGRDCCSMPGACAGAGLVIGLVLACLLPATGSRKETVSGMLVGVAAVAPLKCTSLLLGEALGLMGGLLAGVLAATLLRSAVAGRSVRG